MLRIVVTFWNAAPYIRTCLRSIRSQTLSGWHCYVYDDCSTDGGLSLAEAEVQGDDRFSLIPNAYKMWQVGNWWQFAQNSSVGDDDIVVTIDGDDWLPDPGVFGRIAAAYADGSTWVTYGNFLRLTTGGPAVGYCRQLERAADVRQSPWVTSAPRTFKAFLLRGVEKEHLLLPSSGGTFLPCAGDLAVMFPIIEMAGDGRHRCLPDLNYVYNALNPNCDFNLQKSLQEELNRYLRGLPAYKRLRA